MSCKSHGMSADPLTMIAVHGEFGAFEPFEQGQASNDDIPDGNGESIDWLDLVAHFNEHG